MKDERIVLCGANAYEQKYYFNEKFAAIPESIREMISLREISDPQNISS